MTEQTDALDIRLVLSKQDEKISNFQSDLTSVKSDVKNISSDIHRLSNAITMQQAKPAFDLSKMLDLGTKVGLLVSLIVAGIVYITNASISGNMTLMSERLDTQRERLALIERSITFKPQGIIP